MGPWATYVLASYGADVIKVEPPEGDIIRSAPPARHDKMGAVFLNESRGKRSVVLDLKAAEDRAKLMGLCATADVFVHNVRRNAMARLGLTYEDVAAANPRIVYASLVGYGQTGPYADRPAYDDLMQGECGLASLFSLVGDEPPRYVPALIADRYCGISAVNAILGALFHRERTGEGQALEIPMFETMVELVLSDHLGGHTFEPPAGPFGYQRVLTANRRPYATADGYICVLVYNDAQWERFFVLTGNTERAAADPKLATADARRADYAYAYGTVAEILGTRTTAEWLDVLRAHDIPATPANSLADVLRDPHLVATGFLSTAEHPSEGTIRTVGVPTRWSKTQPQANAPAPRLGEHET
ncbi:MAG: CoA transferase [Candidatus Eremiobacteraeota bacterium]|nr:CoA transferase [Candidatus Eremiobacteraeota bacterium]